MADGRQGVDLGRVTLQQSARLVQEAPSAGLSAPWNESRTCSLQKLAESPFFSLVLIDGLQRGHVRRTIVSEERHERSLRTTLDTDWSVSESPSTFLTAAAYCYDYVGLGKF